MAERIAKKRIGSNIAKLRKRVHSLENALSVVRLALDKVIERQDVLVGQVDRLAKAVAQGEQNE